VLDIEEELVVKCNEGEAKKLDVNERMTGAA
jgi:hypothetical protein